MIDFHFEKISFDEFVNYFKSKYDCTEADLKSIRRIDDNIKLPKRATSGSAGYDFFLPLGLDIVVDVPITIPTGIRWVAPEGYFLMLVPRSGLGFKTGFSLVNTVGIIDSDYYKSDNEGHILAKVMCDSKVSDSVLHLEAGKAFMQGIVLPYCTNDDATEKEIRNGGFGSTDSSNWQEVQYVWNFEIS